MSRVDRRPTVARNFLAGDRRSVEWALEQWMAIRPPVECVRLAGDPLFVAATAHGLHTLGRMHGLPGAPFPMECALPPLDRKETSGAQALGSCVGVGMVQTSQLGQGDVLLVVDPLELGGAHLTALVTASRKVRTRWLVQPGTRLPGVVASNLGHGDQAVVVEGMPAVGMSALVEGCLEDAGAARLCVAGAGERLFGTLVGCGDFLLERLATVPGPRAAETLLKQHVCLVEDSAAPPPHWNSTHAILLHVIRQAGGNVEWVQDAGEGGLVMTPRQRVRTAA